MDRDYRRTARAGEWLAGRLGAVFRATPLAVTLKAMGRAEPALGHLAPSKFPAVDAFRPITSAPAWRGEALTGKRIIVCPEQGWGDQIMWGRYLPRLRDAGADVAVVCHPKLGRLFELAGFWTRAAHMDRPIPAGDYWTLFGMLPKLLGGPLPRADYLAFRRGEGGGIGIVPSGNPAHFNDLN